MSGSGKKSLKAALALGGGLVTVGLMAAMLTDDDGPPEDVVDGVQSTMNGLVDRAGGAVAAMAASVHRARVAASDLCGHTGSLMRAAGTCCELGQIRASAEPRTA